MRTVALTGWVTPGAGWLERPDTLFSPSVVACCIFVLGTSPLFTLYAGTDRLADSVDITTLGVRSDGKTIDTSAIEAALHQKPTGKFYFPAGTYALDNSTHPGILVNAFNGSLIFAPGAKVECSTATMQAQDCVKIQNGTSLNLQGLHITYRNATLPLSRAHPAPRGMALRLWHETGANLSDIRVDGSTNVGIFLDESRNCKFTNISIANTSADGFSSVNSGNIELTNLNTKVTMDDGLSIIRYEGKSDYTGFKASDIHVADSAARGITVPGEADVQISNFSVNQTCAQGILVVTDGFYHTRTPDNVTISNGTISGAGHYTIAQNPCKAPKVGGIGLQISGTGDVTVDTVTITQSVGQAIAGSQGPNGPSSGHIILRNIKVSGQNGGGVAIYNAKQLEMSDITLNDAEGGFFIAKNGDVKTKNLTTTNVKGYLNRAFDFEKNNSVDATNTHIVDTKPTPTGDSFVDADNAQPSIYRGVKGDISNGQLKLKTAPSAKVAPNPEGN